MGGMAPVRRQPSWARPQRAFSLTVRAVAIADLTAGEAPETSGLDGGRNALSAKVTK